MSARGELPLGLDGAPVREGSELSPRELEAATLAALSALPKLGPRALGILLRDRNPHEAWAAVRAGRLGGDRLVAAEMGQSPRTRAEQWAEQARRTSLELLHLTHRAARVRLLLPGDDEWPERFDGDPEPPVVLCVRGELSGLQRPTCGIVGTRGCTPDGRRIAYGLGREVASAGVSVISGLALGVDAAAHRGCLAADDTLMPGRGAPFGAVAGGLDRVYPPSHADLFAAVADAGALVSEVPLGTRPERWRFPARNRLIAALSDVVVVVESPERGGSLHTVEAALARDRMVGAVPGPVLSLASHGTNSLLADGAIVVRGAEDVLVALGLGGSRKRGRGDNQAEVRDALSLLGTAAATVYAAVGVTATPLEAILAESGVALGPALTALQRLAAAGLVDDAAGQWTRAGRVR